MLNNSGKHRKICYSLFFDMEKYNMEARQRTPKSHEEVQNGSSMCIEYSQPTIIGPRIPQTQAIEVFIPITLPACFQASFERRAATDGQNDPIPSGKSIPIK